MATAAHVAWGKKNGARNNTSTAGQTKCHGRFVHPDSLVLVGGNHVFGKLLKPWPCGKCGESNKPQMAYCRTNCGGKPTDEYMGKQAELQRKRRLELSLTPGAAPHQPKGNGITNKEREELTKLRAQAATDAAPGVFIVDPSAKVTDKDFKTMEARLRAAKEQATKYPNSQAQQLLLQEAQNEVDQARPPKAVKPGRLQDAIDKLEQQIATAQGSIVRKSNQLDKMAEQMESVKGQIADQCDQVRDKKLEIASLNDQIAKALVFTPPPSTTLPAVTLAHAPRFLDVVKSEFAAATGDVQVSEETKAKVNEFLAGIPAMDQLFKAICILNMAVAADRDIAVGGKEELLALSPERTAASTAASTETTDFATEPTTPTAPPPLPLQSVQCPLRAVTATDPAPALPGVLDVAASKRKGVDEKEDEATTLSRWMAVPSRRAPESDGKKSKLEEGATPMEEDSVTAID